MKRIGLIVNPIAGMGGRVGLKGTDGPDALAQALARGAAPEAAAKATRALKRLAPWRERVLILTCGGDMGENVARALDFSVEVVYEPPVETTPDLPSEGQGRSTGADTQAAARKLVERGVDLLLFAGGDGTARDVYAAVGSGPVTLGIPAGVKIHSPVYANTPEAAGDLAGLYLDGGHGDTGEREVLDIDEEAVRRDVLQTSLHGYLTVPLDDAYMQNPKAPTGLTEAGAQAGIAADIIEGMEENTCYIIGPGTTPRAIMQELGLSATLLGVDAVRNGVVLGADLAEADLLALAKRYRCKLVVTPTGGQGYLLGRGNQQISGSLIKELGKDNVIVVATGDKILKLRRKPLLVDTGDPEADALLAGYHRVVTDYHLEAMHRIAPASG